MVIYGTRGMPSNKSAMTEKEEHSSALYKISSVVYSAMAEKEEHSSASYKISSVIYSAMTEKEEHSSALYKISLAQQRVIPHRLVA